MKRLIESLVERFTSSILKVLADGEVRGELRAKGIQRAQRFRYETSVKQLLEVFEATLPTGIGRDRLESA
jgi:hypothetical protein